MKITRENQALKASQVGAGENGETSLTALKLDAERMRSLSNGEAFTAMISMTGSRLNMSCKKKRTETGKSSLVANVS